MGVLRASLDTAYDVIALATPTASSDDVDGFSATTEDPFQMAGRKHLKELGWLVPLAIGGIIAMILLALLFYFGVTALERKMSVCCFNTFGCCRASATGIREESEALSRTYAMQENRGYNSTAAYNVNSY